MFVAAHVALSQTWNLTNLGSNEWQCVASSADGSILIAGQWLGDVGRLDKCRGDVDDGYDEWVLVFCGGFPRMERNYWRRRRVGPALNSAAFPVHEFGTKLDFEQSAGIVWGSLAISADGKTIAAAGIPASFGDSYVFCSTNSGITWTSNGVGFACRRRHVR